MKQKKPLRLSPRLRLHLPGILSLLCFFPSLSLLSLAAREGAGRMARGLGFLGALLFFSLSVFFLFRWLKALRRAWRAGTFLPGLKRKLSLFRRRLASYRENRRTRRAAALALRGIRTESFRLTAKEREKGKKRRKARRSPETAGEHIRFDYALTVSRSVRAGVRIPSSRTPRELSEELAHTPERRELFSLYETVRYAEREPALTPKDLDRLRRAAEDAYTGNPERRQDRPDGRTDPKGTL